MTTAVPPAPRRNIDLARALRSVTDDPGWVAKLAIGSGLALASCLLIPLPLIAGYKLRVIRGAAHDRPGLPEWDDWGGLFMEGLLLLALCLAHLLPLALAAGIGFGGVALVTRAASGPDAETVRGLAFGAIALCLAPIAIAWGVYVHAAMVRMAVAERLGAGFEVGENLGFLRRNPLNWLVAFVILWAGGVVANLGYLACIIGVIPATVWAGWVADHAFGQIAALDPGATP
jgi:hypothetical protein